MAAPKLSKLEKQALEAAVEATKAGSYVFMAEEFYQPLVDAGLVIINTEITNEAGDVAVKAILAETETPSNPVNEPTQTKENGKMSFEIESGVEMPKAKRGGKRESAYPFDKLEVGQSFFIPASEKHPEPAKSLASTVSGATKRYDVPDLDNNGVQKTKSVTNPKTKVVTENVPAMKHTRIFYLVAAEKDGVKGARVFRKQ